MSSLFGLLGASATGLHAHSLGMSVASQNAQNATTEGYTRRDVRLSPIAPPPDGGGGVRARGGRRIMDELLDRRLLGASAARAEGQARSESLGVLDRVFADFEGGLGSSLDDFEASLTQLTDRPSDPATRRSVLAAAGRLANSFQSAARQLGDARADANSRIEAEVQSVDGKLGSIAELGVRIQRAEIGGVEASDLRDQRDQLVRDLSEQIPVTTVTDHDGGTSVLLGGLALVTPDGRTAGLSTVTDPSSGDVSIVRKTAGVDQDVTALVTGGSIGGIVAARDGALADAVASLDQLASDTAGAYNAVHTAGYGTDGVSGRNLFAPPGAVTGAAAAFAVSSDVAGDPTRIAAATDPALAAGDNRNALALAAVADSSVALGGTATLQGALGSIIGDAGNAVRGASLDASVSGDFAAQLESLRASVSGVSVDEEMISLAKYQRGYQASLRVVQAADQMLQELVNLRR